MIALLLPVAAAIATAPAPAVFLPSAQTAVFVQHVTQLAIVMFTTQPKTPTAVFVRNVQALATAALKHPVKT